MDDRRTIRKKELRRCKSAVSGHERDKAGQHNEPTSKNNATAVVDKLKERNKNIVIFQEESAKSEDWKKKYIHSTLFLLGYGAYGSVFQVTTRLYSHTRHRIARERYVYHADFLSNYASQRRLKLDQYDKLRDKVRHERLFDTVAIKYEILDQSMLEDGATRFCLFLRREFLVLDTIWRRYHRLLVGFPVVFEFGYIGDKLQYGVNSKYKNIFTYLNLQGEEVKFFADTHNRNLMGVTKISYMTMELLGPSVEDYRVYFDPWYEKTGVRSFFQVRTTFRIADQLLCRLYVLHKAGFVHHDLKPDNLALGHGRAMNTIYLIDFGFAKQVADNAVEEWMGSRKYISVDAYSGERANYAQDVESWFYLVMSLLYDSLPWSDDVILPMLDVADEAGRWVLAASIKRTWWEDSNGAKTLYDMIDQLQKLHQREVPDIGQILNLLHRRVRDLREHLRQIRDPKASNAELSNSHSKASSGYMSIRKVLLQIFDLPKIGKNRLLGDQEFRAYQDARRAQDLMPFPWEQNDFQWEWDRNHQRMLSGGGGSSGGGGGAGVDVGVGAVRADRLSELNDQIVSGNNHRNRIRRHIEKLPAFAELSGPAGICRRRQHGFSILGDDDVRGSRQERADEVSYVFDSRNNCLVPKWPGGCAAGRRQQKLRHRTASAIGRLGGRQVEELLEKEAGAGSMSELLELANPAWLQSWPSGYLQPDGSGTGTDSRS